MDFSLICRLCLAEKQELSDIFTETELENFNFSDAVFDIAQVKVEPEDAFSKGICTLCKDLCTQFLRFRDQIISSFEYQRSVLESEMKGVDESIIIEQFEEFSDIEQEKPAVIVEEIEINNSEDEDLSNETNNIYVVVEDEKDGQSDDDDYIESSDDTEDENRIKNRCYRCRKTFRNEEEYKKHVVTHSYGAREYSCEICKRRFSTEDQKKRHEIIHSDLVLEIQWIDKYRCIVCNIVQKSEVS